jgi:hypothetical protein
LICERAHEFSQDCQIFVVDAGKPDLEVVVGLSVRIGQHDEWTPLALKFIDQKGACPNPPRAVVIAVGRERASLDLNKETPIAPCDPAVVERNVELPKILRNREP